MWIPIVFFLSGGNLEKNVDFLRLMFFILSALMVLIVRFLTFFIDRSAPFSSLRTLLGFVFMFPALLISALGYLMARLSRNPWEYLLFYLIALYHILRFWKWGEKRPWSQ